MAQFLIELHKKLNLLIRIGINLASANGLKWPVYCYF